MWETAIYMFVALGVIIHPLRAQQAPVRDCQTTDPNPYFYFGSKTAYELVNVESTLPISVAGCQPAMFWMLARHGAVYPPPEEVSNMRDGLERLRRSVLENHKERRGKMNELGREQSIVNRLFKDSQGGFERLFNFFAFAKLKCGENSSINNTFLSRWETDVGKLCRQDVDNIMNNGSFRVDTDAGGMLTPTGREELLLLGRRYRARFADLFHKVYTPEDFEFRHLPNKASLASARAFSKGLFNIDDAALNQVAANDPVLKFYGNCTKWNEKVGNNPAVMVEFEKFEKGPVFQRDMLADVVARLGFQYNMSTADLLLIYDACRYEKVWFLQDISPWCAAFNEDNLKILEYAEDLQAYSLNGYANEINYKQACPLVEDLVTRMRAKERGEKEKGAKGVFYFTETEGILRFAARMGIDKDKEALTGSNYESMSQRQWRTSFLNPFSANLAFVLYQCEDGYKVQTYLKEALVRLPGCESELCPLDSFMKQYGQIADNCAKEDVCNSNSATSFTSMFVLALTALIGQWAFQQQF